MTAATGPRALGRHLAPATVISGDRAGWKAGLGVDRAAALGLEGPLVGRLATAQVHPSGAEISASGWTDPRIEPEVAVRFGRDVRPDAGEAEIWDCVEEILPAFELIDLTGGLDDVDAMLGVNIYHRAAVLGAPVDPASLEGAPIRMRLRHEGLILGDTADAGAAVGGIRRVVAHIARVLAAAEERLRAGDLILTGTIVFPPPIEPGVTYSADFGVLGAVSVRIRG